MVTQITNIEEFDRLIKENHQVVVDCFATWCGPCKMLGPVIDEASANRSSVLFLKVDIDKVEEIPERYGISSIPNVLFFEDGKIVHEFLGYIPLDDVLNQVDQAFKK